MLEEKSIIKLGFKKVKHIFLNSYTLDIGRDRSLSISSIGTPNEMLFICQHSHKDYRIIEDIVTLKNYDYDGYLTIDELSNIINFFTTNNKT